MYQNGQIAQSVEHGIENPGVGGSIPSLATFFVVIAMCVGCSADPCAVLCKETAVALDTCMDEWSITWEHLDAADARDFRDRCTNRWGGVRSKLVAREIEDARDQCDEGRDALKSAVSDQESCDLLRVLYLE